MPKVIRLGILLFVSFLLLLTGCQTHILEKASEKPIILGTTLKPHSLDPADTYELAGLMLIYNLGDTLYSYELGTTNLQPKLAVDFPTVSSDGLTYTIELRSGIVFHDGTTFNAKAMAFSLQRFIKNGGSPSFLLADTLEKIEVTGEYEIQLHLKQPFAALTSLLAFPGTCALSPAAYKIGEGKFNSNRFVGTGPYRLIEMTGDRILLAVFDKYWGDKPKNKKLQIQMYPGNPTNLYNALKTGSVDLVYQSLATQQVSKLKKEAFTKGKWQVIQGKGSAINYLSLNLTMNPLKALKVRQAVSAMINRSFLVERILEGQGEPLYSLVPTNFEASQEVFTRENITLAKKLLNEAGFSESNPANVELWYSSGSINSSILAAILKSIAKRDLNGILNFEPNSIASTAFFHNISQGTYISSVANWYPDFLDPDNYLYPFLSCSKGSLMSGCQKGSSQQQGSFYYSHQMNELLSQERAERDPYKRNKIFGQIQKLLAEEVPYIPLWQSNEYAFAQNNIKGAVINPSQTFPFWTLERK